MARGYRIDLHVHTARYSQCAETLAPSEIGVWAARAGLDAVLLADHDMLWTQEEVDALRGLNHGVRLYRGIECTARDGHVVVVGLDDAGAFSRALSVAEVCELAHKQDAAAVLAHPFRGSSPTRLPFAVLDAIEVASTSFSEDESRRSLQLAQLVGKPVVAASDAHALPHLGWAWTEFPAEPEDERGLAAMIRSGAGIPKVPHRYVV